MFCALLGIGVALMWEGRGGGARPALARHEFGTMRTTARFVLLNHPGLAEAPDVIFRRAEAAVRDVENYLNPYREGSDLWRLNHAAPGEWVAVHPLTWRVAMEALRFHRLSGGAFDPTIGPLKLLYFPDGKPRGDLPPEAERLAAAEKVGARHLRYEREGMRLSWAREGMRLDLSALAKGFAVDLAMDTFLAAGARDALVEIGGEMRMAGTVPMAGLASLEVGAVPPPDADGDAVAARRPWRVQVWDPRQPDRPEAEQLYLTRTWGAMATSGDYEQYFEVDGERYSHLIDPRAGRPVRGVAAATVVLPGSCMQADALATVMCVLGPEAAKTWLEERADDLLSDGVEVWLYALEVGGGVRRERIVIPGDGLDRMMAEGGSADAPRDPVEIEADLADESRWLRSILDGKLE